MDDVPDGTFHMTLVHYRGTGEAAPSSESPMPDPLTAQALHELYWTLPESARPVGLRFQEADEPGEPGEPAAWFSLDSIQDGLLEIPDEVAAALCRVAAEDWLVMIKRSSWGAPRYGSLFIHQYGEGRFTATCSFQESKVNDPEFPTVHHALVAACLAVAEGA